MCLNHPETISTLSPHLLGVSGKFVFHKPVMVPKRLGTTTITSTGWVWEIQKQKIVPNFKNLIV